MEEVARSMSVNNENEISVKELILKIRDWIKFLFSKWLIIGIIGIIGAGVGVAFSIFSPTKYTAELTFILEDSKSNSLANYAGIASQFGIDLGGGSTSGVFSEDNILEFLRSRLMIEKAFLSAATINGKTQSLADFYIDITGKREKWKEKKFELTFTPNLPRDKYTLSQDSVLQELYYKIIGDDLTIEKPDKKLAFVDVNLTTEHELFSKVFTEKLVAVATDFYVQTKTQRSKSNVDKLQAKADSIERLLNKKTYAMAASQDINLNPAKNISGVSIELEGRDKLILQTMYGEVLKNLELSKIAMLQETPIIQVIDAPILPLKIKKFGFVKGFVVGAFLGAFLTIIVLCIRRLYKKIMN
ncbi:subunit length determinant protein [Chitinophaga skermanii]|uniref:Subunit length determinant protein n=1 Tax=Chitinophaga skermanii TaxID=331697 RepID=A0A327R457_9BACT|nr:lipopolysaccharide biosynthesis protein [Chitinophaga skermanii]RAJ10513.1 subunit length determinant protein [Chitinophaga skermanii]